MSAYDVLGNNVLIEMNIDGTYFPVFCAKDAGITTAQDEIETTHINSGAFREYVPGMNNSILNLTGVTHINSGNGRVPITYLMQPEVLRSIQTYRLTLTDNSANVITMTMDAFVTNASITGPRGGLSNSNLSLRVTGGIIFGSDVPTPSDPVCEIQDTLYLDTVVGTNTVQDDLLKDGVAYAAEILLVSRTGDVYAPVTGTPDGTALEYKFTSSTGTLAFGTGRPFEAGEVITVMYKTTTGSA